MIPKQPDVRPHGVPSGSHLPGNGALRPRVGQRAPAYVEARKAPSLPRDPLHITLFLFMIIVLSRVHAYLGLEALRPAFLLTAIAVAYAIMKPSTLNFGVLKGTWPARVMLAFMALACLSVPFSISVGGAAAFILDRFSRTFIPVMLIVLAMRDFRDLRLFLWSYVIGCGLLAFISIFVVGLAKVRGAITYDPNDVGLIMVIGIPLTLAAFQTSGKVGKLLSLVILMAAGVTLALSESRGAFVGLLAVGAALLLLLKQIPVAKRVAFAVTVGLVLAVAAPAGYWDLMQTITSPTDDYNWHTPYGRKALTERSIGYMISNPLTGLGVGQTPRAEASLAGPAQHYFETGEGRIKWSVAHNSFLEAGADLGFGGFLLFAGLIFGGIASMMRLQRHLSWTWAKGDVEQQCIFYMTLYLPIALIGFAVAGSLLSHTYSIFAYFLAALMVGVFAALQAQRRRAAQHTPPSAPPGTDQRLPLGGADSGRRRPCSGRHVPVASARTSRAAPRIWSGCGGRRVGPFSPS